MSIRYLSGINVDSNTLFVDDANNRVGIGTGSPVYKFEVSNGTITGTMNPNSSGFMFIGSTTNHPLYFGVYDATRMMISTAGNVGIGTTAPVAELNVVGTSTEQLVISYDSTKRMILGRTNSYGWIQPYTNGVSYDNLILNRDGGNVGIGTTNPIAKFVVSNSGAAGMEVIPGTSSANGGTLIEHYNRSTSAYVTIRTIAADHRFDTSSGEAMRIISGGNVGIGTTSPNAKLVSSKDVSSNDFNNLGAVQLKVTGSTNYNKQLLIGFETDNNYGLIQTLEDGASWSSYNLAIQPKGGNVGIGTTAPYQSKLHVTKSESGATPTAVLRIGNQGAGYTSRIILTDETTNDANISYLGATQSLGFGLGTSLSQMVLTSAGNVGIGTTSPSYKASIVAANGNYWNGTAFTGTPLALSIENSEPGGYDPVLIYNQADSGGTLKNSGAIGMIGTGPWTAGNNALQVSDMYFLIRNSSGGISERLRIKSTGAAQLKAYGSGSFTGTVAYNLAVDSSGNIIETAGGVVDGSGTANYVSKWSDANTLTDSQLFDNGTNVGIGTTSPISKLQVNGQFRQLYSRAFTSNPLDTDGYAGHIIVNSNNANGDLAGIGLYTNSSYNAAAGLFALQESSTAASMVFYAGSSLATERMRITSAGNVGIGTTAPSAKLHISGSSTQLLVQGNNYSGIHQAYAWVTNTYFGARYDGTNEVYGATGRGAFKIVALHDGDNDPQYLAFYGANAGTAGSTITWNTVGFAQDEDGNVGIGTTAPTQKLDVRGFVVSDSQSNGSESAFYLGNSAHGLSRDNLANDVTLYTTAGDVKLSANTAGVTHLIVKNSGAVGINTTNPTQLLQVAGNETGASKINAVGTIYGSGAFLNAFSSAGGNDVGFAGFIASQANQTNRMWTGVHSPSGANQAFIGTPDSMPLAFWTNSAEQMRITSAGNVGIGTTAPTTGVGLTVKRPTGTGWIIDALNSSNTRVGGFYSTSGGNGQLYLSNNAGTETIVIDSAGNSFFNGGNVGIGTTAPAYKLEIRGAFGTSPGAYISGSTYGMLGVNKEINNASAGIQYYNVGSQKWFSGIYENTDDFGFYSVATGSFPMVIQYATGNVGIGTTGPVQKLHVAGKGLISNAGITGTPSWANNSFEIQSSSGQTVSLEFHRGGYTSSQIWSDGNNLIFGNNSGTERMRIQDGNVGIGTTAPVTQLNILYPSNIGKDTVQGIIRLTGQANTENAGTVPSAGTAIEFYNKWNGGGSADEYSVARISGRASQGYAGSLQFDVAPQQSPGQSNFLTAMSILRTGNVGIGTTSPAKKLHVYNSGPNQGLRASNADGVNMDVLSGANGGIVGTYSNHPLSLYTNSTEKVTITSGGNVGINTTNPLYRLDVTGSARVNSTSNLVMFIKTSSSFGAGISFEDSTTGGNDVVSAGAIGAGFYINTGFSERLRINSSGFVGIATTPSSSWTLAIDSLPGADGAIKATGSVNINSGALGVNVTPSGTAGRIDASNDIVAFSTSDRRFKENITPIANALDKVKTLTGVEFDWKMETKDYHGYVGHDVGVIAQDVQAVLPEAVRTNANGYLAVRYEKIIGLLVEAMKEQQSQIDELKAKLDGLTK